MLLDEGCGLLPWGDKDLVLLFSWLLFNSASLSAVGGTGRVPPVPKASAVLLTELDLSGASFGLLLLEEP